MSALAKFLKKCGYDVSGSDAYRGEQTETLIESGVKIYIGEDENREALRLADAVVYTDAIPNAHKELQAAIALQKRLLPRAQLLDIVCRQHEKVLSIAGSHGKTTCTSICAHAFLAANTPFTAHIGGEDALLGNFYSSGRQYLVTEACEYKKNLLNIRADVAVLLNIDKDHMECYADEEDLRNSFLQYCNNAKTAFVCADDARCVGLGDFQTFGVDSVSADYRAVKLRAQAERYSFTVQEYGKELCRIRLNAIGKCNVYNALAAFAAMRSFGFLEEELTKGIENFTAVKRRFEKIGAYKGATFICDYAHHPREILSSVKTAKGICRGKLYVVFQPHTYSRTKLLLNEFIDVLRSIDDLMIYKTYPARENYDADGSGKRLAECVGNCLYAENVYALKTWLKTTLKDGDTVLFLGAGDIYYAAQYLLKDLL